MLKIEDRRVWQGPDQILRMMNVRSKFVVADLGCVHAQTARPRQAKDERLCWADSVDDLNSLLTERPGEGSQTSILRVNRPLIREP